MNVLFVSNHYYPYGLAAEKRIRLFAEALQQQHDVSVVVTGLHNGRNPDSGVHNSVPYKLNHFSKYEYLINLPKIFKILKNGYDENASGNILFLYSNLRVMNIWFAIIGKLLGFMIVTDIVENDAVTDEHLVFFKKHKVIADVWIQYAFTGWLDGIVTISHKLMNQYSGFKNIILIPISAENLFHRPNSRTESAKVRFKYSGGFKEKDGVSYMIGAFRRLPIDKVELILSGSITQTVQNMIQDVENIKYVGLVPDTDFYDFLADSDALLMTRSDSEYANTGFPFKLGEYLATGNVVIASDVGDIKNYLTDGEDILLVKPGSISSLEQVMRKVIEKPKFYEKIGLAGKKSCEKYFSPDKNGKLLETFLLNIIDNK